MKGSYSQKHLESIILNALTKKHTNVEVDDSIENGPKIVKIKNCIFKLVSNPIINLKLDYMLVFERCEFKIQTLRFEKGDFKSLIFNECIFDIDLELEDCNGQIHFNGSKFKENVSFRNCLDLYNFQALNSFFEKSLIFINTNFKEHTSLQFENNDFKSEVLFNGLFKGHIIFSDNIFHEKVIFGSRIHNIPKEQNEKSRFYTLTINSGEFKKKVVFNKAIFENKLWLTSSLININFIDIRLTIFKKEVVFGYLSINIIVIYGGTFIEGLKTNFAKIKSLYITGGRFTKVEIKEGYLEKLEIENFHEIDNLRLSANSTYIKEIIISQSNPLKAIIKRNQIYQISQNFKSSWLLLNCIRFDSSSLHKDSVIQIYNVELRGIFFNYYLNLGNIVFNNVSFYSTGRLDKNFRISLINSDLGKTSFLDCRNNLKNYAELEFSNSKIFESYFSNNVLPEKLRKPKDQLEKVNSFNSNLLWPFEQKEQLYNQLRKLSENKSDTSSSIYYKAKSYNARLNILFIRIFAIFSKGGRTIPYVPNFILPIINLLLIPFQLIYLVLKALLNNDARKDLFEFFTLFINWISNNHGSSWQRGLLGTLIMFFGLYFIYCRLSGITIGDLTILSNRKYFWEVFSHIGDFLNPIPKEDTYNKFYKVYVDFPKARLFGVFSKIVISYFIFQTIQAFRRFGKTN